MDNTTLPQTTCVAVHSRHFAEEEQNSNARERYNEWRGENLRELKSDFLSSLHTSTIIEWLLEENEESYFSIHASQFDIYCEKCYEEEECFHEDIPLPKKEEGETK